ncbi:HNH endonuclease [Limnobacter sp.]
MIKKKGKSAVAGKDVDHKDRNPMNNSASNLRVQSPSKNRSRNK